MVDLILVEIGDIVNIFNSIKTDVSRDAEDLIVAAGLVDHMVQAYCAALYCTSREYRFREHNKGVQRIAVFAEGTFDITVIIRVHHRSEQDAVQLDAACFVIDFILVVGTLRDLNKDIKCFCHKDSFGFHQCVELIHSVVHPSSAVMHMRNAS